VVTEVGKRLSSLAFTLIELLIALAIMATLMSLVVPRYFQAISSAKEATLKSNLRAVREAIDKFKADQGRYPDALDDLVSGKYINAKPIDPVTDRSDTWVLLPPPGEAAASGVFDLKSGSQGLAKNGEPR